MELQFQNGSGTWTESDQFVLFSREQQTQEDGFFIKEYTWTQ